MKIRMKTWQLVACLVLIMAGVITLTVLAQTKEPLTESCKGHHTRKDFRTNVRMVFPITVLEITGNRLNYAVADEGIELGSFDLEPNYSLVPPSFAEQHNGCYSVHYCEKHKVILQVDELPQNACTLTKN